jgi:hypothetical protein
VLSKKSILFSTGFLGFIIGFFSWLFGLLGIFIGLMTASPGNFSGYLVRDELFFLSNQLLYVSFLLSALGFFALKKYYGSNAPLACGISSILVFIVNNARTLLLSLFSRSVDFRDILIYPSLMVLYSGIMFWGITFLSLRLKTEDTQAPKRIRGATKAGILFILAGVIGFLVFAGLLCYTASELRQTIDLWYLLGGWAYAAGTAFASLIMLRLLSDKRETNTA